MKKENLYNLYERNTRTSAEIVRDLGLKEKTVRNWVEKYITSSNNRNESE